METDLQSQLAQLEAALQAVSNGQEITLLSLYLGQAYERAGGREKAVEAYLRVVQYDTDPRHAASVEAYTRLGDLAPQRLYWLPVKAAFEAAIAHHQPNDPQAARLLFRLGTLADRLNQREAAERYLSEGLRRVEGQSQGQPLQDEAEHARELLTAIQIERQREEMDDE